MTRSYELTLERTQFEPPMAVTCGETDIFPTTITIRPFHADNSRNYSCDTTPLELVGAEWGRGSSSGGMARRAPTSFFQAATTGVYPRLADECPTFVNGLLFVSRDFDTADEAFDLGGAEDFLWTYGALEQGEPCASWMPDEYQHCTADFRVTAIREVTEP